MADLVDFFFSPYPSAQERRLQAALEDGLAHGSRITPHDPVPGEEVILLFSTQVESSIEQIAVYYNTDETEPSGHHGFSSHSKVVLATPAEIVYEPALEQSVRYWHATLPAQPAGTLVRYRADGWNRDKPQEHWYADRKDPVSLAPDHGRIFAYNVDDWRMPDWFHQAIIYQIFVDRFSAGRNERPLLEAGNITEYFGGTLRGVIEKLDYIQALGVNCIWLSPIFESPIYHGYNPSDYFNVAARYGSNETLHELIEEVHRRGMRILLDYVANHTSDQHPAFLDAKHNPDATTRHWYAIGDWPPHGYRSYALVGSMPELMTDDPDVQHYLADAALHWIEHFGADGLRLDYVPGPSHAFWTLFQREIKGHFPDALTLGEITSPLSDISEYEGRIDAFMDFPLANLLRSTFGQRKTSLAELFAYLDERIPQLPANMGRATLLDNHDMHRFLWLADGDSARLKLAAACHFTLEGSPIIYYGTEVGLNQISDAHTENAYARPPMLWNERQDQSLLEYYRRLTTIRQNSLALQTGKRRALPVELIEGAVEEKDQIGAYLRWLPDANTQEKRQASPVLVVLNNGEQRARIRIPLKAQLPELEVGERLEVLLATPETTLVISENGSIEIELAAVSAAIIKL